MDDQQLVSEFVEFVNGTPARQKSAKQERMIELLDYIIGHGSENFVVRKSSAALTAVYEHPYAFQLECEFSSNGFVNVKLYVSTDSLVEPPQGNIPFVLYTKCWIKLGQPFIDDIKQKNICTVMRRLSAGDKFDGRKKAFV